MKRFKLDPAFEEFIKMTPAQRTSKYGKPEFKREYNNGIEKAFLCWRVSNNRWFRQRLHDKPPQND